MGLQLLTSSGDFAGYRARIGHGLGQTSFGLEDVTHGSIFLNYLDMRNICGPEGFCSDSRKGE